METRPIDQIAAILGLTAEETPAYCDSVRADFPVGRPPSNQDIAQALNELQPSNVAPAEVAKRAREIAEVRRASKPVLRRAKAASVGVGRAHAGAWTGRLGTNSKPFARCRSCGRPVIPGSDTCYTHS
jgi:hypothetical protein